MPAIGAIASVILVETSGPAYPKEPQSVILDATPGAEGMTVMPPTQAQPSGPEDAYKVELSLAGDRLPAELALLADPKPVEITTSATQVGALPAGWRERDRRIDLQAGAGVVTPLAGADPNVRRWIYQPPERSTLATLRAVLRVTLEGPDAAARTIECVAEQQVLSPSPASLLIDGVIDGFDIGTYLDPDDPKTYRDYRVESTWPAKYPARYRRPDYYFKVTPEIKALHISPHVTLGFWLIDFPWKSLGATQYLALDLNLVRKLEDLRESMVADGFKITQFVPIYGFRPPSFNLSAIHDHPDTNLKEPFSMHQYGRAVDMIIDEDGDGAIDDLNRDGKIDVQDAVVMMHYVNILDRKYREEGRMEMVGGAGLYDHHDFVERPMQSPYVHVDTRGFLRDNGTLVRWPDQWPDGAWIRWGEM
jgi:hypothetical protein